MAKQEAWSSLSLTWSSDIGAKPRMAIRTRRITRTNRMRNRNLKMIIGGGNPQTKSERVKTQAGGFLSLNKGMSISSFLLKF
jgi:hypothetical protein